LQRRKEQEKGKRDSPYADAQKKRNQPQQTAKKENPETARGKKRREKRTHVNSSTHPRFCGEVSAECTEKRRDKKRV
jgi:hypothetical protein